MSSSSRSLSAWSPLAKQVLLIVAISLAILGVGTLGYRWISEPQASWLDCLYMTVITVLTIGSGEIIDLSRNPGGRIFTMFLGFSGIAVIGYTLSALTSFAVGGELRRQWWRWKMYRAIESLRDHYLIAGWSDVGCPIVEELKATHRPYVIVASSDRVPAVLREGPASYTVDADPCDENSLRAAGIDRAQGVFAISDEDPINIVICMTARQLGPNLRIVALASDPKNEDKLRKAGADAVVNATRIGGLRLASEMIRPTVVDFLDIMLRDRDRNLRVEEVTVGTKGEGRRLQEISWQELPKLVLVALKRAEGWEFNPPSGTQLHAGDCLIVIGAPQEREKLQQIVGDGS